MPEYRRAFVPGGTFFFTVVTEQRVPLFGDAGARRMLQSAFLEARSRLPFTVDAIVILPDHLHAIWTLPDGDADFSTRWSFLKRTFTKSWLARQGQEQPISDSRKRNRRRGVWQRRFWEHAIRDEGDFERHCDYIHYNPVKHDLASCPHAWPHSSFCRFVREGFYNESWLCSCAGRLPTRPSFDDIEETAAE